MRIFVDEAHELIGNGKDAVTVLAEARKWDLGLKAETQFPITEDDSEEE